MTKYISDDDLIDSIYTSAETPRQSAFSRYSFTTTSPAIKVAGTTDLHSYFSSWCQIGVIVDDVEHSVFNMSDDGQWTFDVDLGSPGVSKSVVLVNGLQSTGGTSTAKGTFLDSVSYIAGSNFAVSSYTPTDRIVIYGDSIAVGGNSTDPPMDAWPVLLRTSYDRDIVVEAWGWRTLYDDADTAGKRTTFATQLLSGSPSTIYIAIGTNDYGLDKWSSANFGTALAALLDEIHSQDDSVAVIVQCPTYRTDEATPNSFGDDLDDYRSAESTACSGRGWATYYDASAVLDAGDLADALHPTTAGHAKYALAVDTYLDSL